MTTDRELPKIRKALERIADACERYADADPLTVLNEALSGAESDPGATLPQNPLVPAPEPQGWFASNGTIYMYRHPREGWHIVARPDADAESGYTVAIEEAS